MSEKSVFEILSNVNVEEYVKQKNKFNYLSWASAVEILLNKFPQATWEHTTWGDLPYLQTGAGCFVEMSVTIQGITRKQLHPVLDFRNKPVLKPDAFQVNSSLQRALAKAIALHGLGLNVFTGEDLPLGEREALDGAKETLTQLLKEHNVLNKQASDWINNTKDYDALITKINEYKTKEV